MKYIDPKSLTIGVLAASLVFACTDSNNKTTNSPSLVSEAKAATGVGDKWDDKQEWLFAASAQLDRLGLLTEVQLPHPDGTKEVVAKVTGGWEPWAHAGEYGNRYFRKRIK